METGAMIDTSFDAILNAQRIIYSALRPLPKQIRDRVLRNVMETLNSERAPLRQVEKPK
jgi:hypothetical protein